VVILVVDDERGLTDVMQEILEAWGDVCLVARDVEEAEMILRTTRVDAMALDLNMPGRDPLQWLLELGEAHHGVTRRTVVTTGRDLDEDEARRIHGSGAGVLPKPFRARELRDALRLQARGDA